LTKATSWISLATLVLCSCSSNQEFDLRPIEEVRYTEANLKEGYVIAFLVCNNSTEPIDLPIMGTDGYLRYDVLKEQDKSGSHISTTFIDNWEKGQYLRIESGLCDTLHVAVRESNYKQVLEFATITGQNMYIEVSTDRRQCSMSKETHPPTITH